MVANYEGVAHWQTKNIPRPTYKLTKTDVSIMIFYHFLWRKNTIRTVWNASIEHNSITTANGHVFPLNKQELITFFFYYIYIYTFILILIEMVILIFIRVATNVILPILLIFFIYCYNDTFLGCEMYLRVILLNNLSFLIFTDLMPNLTEKNN